MREKEALQGCPPGQVPSVFHQTDQAWQKDQFWGTRGSCTDIESVSQPCPTLYYPMDCSLPGSSVHGILQVRILE